VRLLFDQNLSRRLVRELASLFPDGAHVSALGLDTATDREIWTYAGEHGYLIVSKDSDFRQLAGAPEPDQAVVPLTTAGRLSAATCSAPGRRRR